MMKLLEKCMGRKRVDEAKANRQTENSGTRFNQVRGSFATTKHVDQHKNQVMLAN